MICSMRNFRLCADERGGVLVEATTMISIIFIFITGSVDFLYAFYQWNAAAKAVEIGARIAAVSNPVALGLSDLSKAVVAAGQTCPSGSLCALGEAMPDFKVTCVGTSASSGSCTCTGTCTGVGGYDATAMNAIVFGRGNSTCHVPSSSFNVGMCNFFDRVGPANVIVTYTQTGLGYAGRKHPVPTISVFLKDIRFQFVFLADLLGFGNMPISVIGTRTGEDLSSTY